MSVSPRHRPSQHTPGPWRVVGPLDAIFSDDPYGHGSMRVADVRGWGHLTGDGGCRLEHAPAVAIQQANAALIAAAPDLLAASKALLDRLNDEYDEETNNACDALSAAIAKAEGRP